MIGEGTLSVRLLGHPEVRRAGVPVHLATRKTLLLLARLASVGRESRETLMALLWPDADEERARMSLRRTLAYLRDGCGRDLAVVTADRLSLGVTDAVITDIDAVRRAQDPAADLDSLTAAVAAWTGDFLEGLKADGDELDEWLSHERASWHQRCALVCERLVEQRARAGDAAGALDAVDRWLARDPLAEAAHREHIRVHLIRCDRSAALIAYERCCEVFARELGIAPSQEIETLAARARGGEPSGGDEERLPLRPEVPLVGRDSEHGALAAAFLRAEGGAPELALVRGEPGIGKTRLLTEFALWAAVQNAQVLRMTAFPSDRRLAYQAVGEALGDLLSAHAAAAGTPGAELDLFETAATFLADLAAHRPLLITIDDLHWVDLDSRELLAYVITALGRRRARVLFVISVREDEVNASRSLQDWVARAAHELTLTEISLRPLADGESRRLVALWPERVAALETVVERAQGRPLLLVEMLRFLSQGGDPDTIPPAVREAMNMRLRALDAEARRLAAAAAVIEKPATTAALMAVAEMDATTAQAAMDTLLLRRVLAGDGQYSFTHELLRVAAYSALTATSRRELHRRAALALDGGAGGSAAEVARHAELAGDLELAWSRRLEAGREAARVAAHRAAADHFRAAIAIGPDMADTWLALGRAEELSGRSDLAADTYRMLAERSERAGRPADEAAAWLRLAELAGRDIAAGLPHELFARAAEAAADSGDVALQLEAGIALTQVHAYRGELRLAAAEVDAAAQRATSLGRDDLLARTQNLGAFVHQAQGEFHESLALARRAIASYRRLGDDLMRLDSTGYETAALVFLGEWRSALRRVRRALSEAQRLENPWAVANLSLVESWALRDGGMLDEALAAAERGAAAAEVAGFTPLLVLNAAIGGRCRRELGDVAGALHHHTSMIEAARAVGSVGRQTMTEELCADHAVAGDWDAAATWAAESIAAWGEMRMFGYLSLWAVAEASLRSGGAFAMPTLPAGRRYDVVRLRAEAVVARCRGSRDSADDARTRALAVAEELGLTVESRELRSELASDAAAGVS